MLLKGLCEQSLIARWSFDEGNGSVAVDSTGGGLDLLLSANAKWGSIDVNNTAISKHSLDLMNGDSYARVLAHEKLKANGFFPIFSGLNPMASLMHTASCFPRRKTDTHHISFKSSLMEKVLSLS